MTTPNEFDTVTKLSCSIAQAEQLIVKLQEAIRDARHRSMTYARQDCEQFNKDGPWRLVIAVQGEDD